MARSGTPHDRLRRGGSHPCEQARSRITESTNSVANAAQWLQRVADDPQSRTFAIERLEVAAARQLGELAAVESQYFDAPDGPAAADLGAADEDLLATALSQLEIGNTLVAAGRALGEGGTADPSLLDGASVSCAAWPPS